MDQWETLRAELIHRKKQDSLLHAAQVNDMAILKEAFPTAQDLVNYDQSKKRQASTLETLVQYSSPNFIKQVFADYFSDESPETLKLKEQFLQARTYTHKKLNYHYFAPYLPQELTSKVSEAYGATQPTPQKPLVSDIAENKTKQSFTDRIKQMFSQQAKPIEDMRSRMEQIYDIIKQQHKSLIPYRNEQDKIRQLQLRASDEKPVHQYHTSANPQTSLIVEMEAIPSLYIRNVTSDDITSEDYKKDDILRLDLENSLPTSQKKTDIVKDVYHVADFPEDYMWSIPSLRRFEKEYTEVINTDAVNLAQVKEFATVGGRFFIESQHSNNNGNSIDHDYIAFAGKRDETSAIVFDSQKYATNNQTPDNVLLHELIHRADCNSGKEFSATQLFKDASKLMIAEDENGLVSRKANHIVRCYRPSSFHSELLAYMNEEGKEKLAYSELATTVREIYGIYTEAKVHNDTKTMEQIATFAPKNLGLEFISSRTFENSGYTQLPDQDKLKASVPQFMEELVTLKTEISARQQLDKDGIEIPDFLKAQERDFPVYSMHLKVAEEFKSNASPEMHLANMEKMLQNASQMSDNKAFLSAMMLVNLYTDTYKSTMSEQFEETPKVAFNQYNRESLLKSFQNELVYLKAATQTHCSRDEALLAKDLNMPISELQQHKKIGRQSVVSAQNSGQLKDQLQMLTQQSNQSGKDEDILKLLGAVEFVAAKTGVENPLGYNIPTARMLSAVPTLSQEFIDKKLLQGVEFKLAAQVEETKQATVSNSPEKNSKSRQINLLRGAIATPKSPVRQTTLDSSQALSAQNTRK